jgi:zinc/manganese transport system substrate-binding protein
MHKAGRLIVVVGVALFACCGKANAEPWRVASFSTVLTEIAQRVGGEHLAVTGLIKPGQDPHEYQPTPNDLKAAADARLILLSGKHLEQYLDKVQQATGGNSSALAVGDLLPTLQVRDEAESPGLSPAANTNKLSDDPHWWNSVANVEKAVAIVRDKLVSLDPANQSDYERNALVYLRELEETDRWARRKIAELPRDKRKLVTSHDAFQYWARDYGFKLYSIEGVNTATEASSHHVTALIDQIKAKQVKAIFVESTLNPKVSREITRETGAKVGGTLYADGLGEGEGSTYCGMIRHNAEVVVDSLK